MSDPGLETPSQSDPLPLRAAANLLNRIIERQPELAARIAELDGRVVLFRLSGRDRQVYATVAGSALSLSAGSRQTPDVSLTGTVADFLALARNQRSGSSLAAGQIDIQGDLAVAQRVQSIIAESGIDFEALLAEFTGDVFAYRFGRAAKAGNNWLRTTLGSAQSDLGEYLLYEKKLVPAAEELERFGAEVDELALEVERLEFKLAELAKRRD